MVSLVEFDNTVHGVLHRSISIDRGSHMQDSLVDFQWSQVYRQRARGDNGSNVFVCVVWIV